MRGYIKTVHKDLSVNPVVKLFTKVTNIIVKMKLLQVLIFLSLFSKTLANSNPNEDEFSESGEESCSEIDEDDEDFNSNNSND